MLMQLDTSMTSHIPIKRGTKYFNYEQINKNESKLLRNNIIFLILRVMPLMFTMVLTLNENTSINESSSMTSLKK